MKTWSMMSSTLLIPVILAVSFLPFGYSLRCYSYSCSNSSFSPQNPCSVPLQEFTCSPMYGLSITPDRCITQRFVSMGSGITIHQEIRNCSYSFQCNQNMLDMLCNTFNVSSGGLMKKCEMGCCEGDLCNSGGPIPTQAPEPTGPSGADLSCLACSNVPTLGVQRDCSNPVSQICGDGQIPGVPQDRCMSVKTMAKMPGSPQPMEYRMKNCSNAVMCNQEAFCASANISVGGALESCQVSCCFGNNCNGPVTTTAAATTITTTAAATTITTTAAAGTQPDGTSAPSVPSTASRHILTDLTCFAALIFTSTVSIVMA